MKISKAKQKRLEKLRLKAIAIIESFGGYVGGWYDYAIPTDAGLLYVSLERLDNNWIPMVFRNEDIDNARELLRRKDAILQSDNFYSGKWNVRVVGNDGEFLLEVFKSRLEVVTQKIRGY